MPVAEVSMIIPVGVIPEDSIGFKITRNGEPVEGANVTLCTKGLIPVSFSRVTDASGRVIFSIYDLIDEYVPVPPEAIKDVPFLFMADIPDSEYGVWKDDVKFEGGKLYAFKLKRYTKVPTFFIKYELRETIGRDLFSDMITRVESWALGWAGFKVTKVEGVGTRFVTIHFQPPWSEHSPFAFALTASITFVIALIVFFVGIIAVILVLDWKFGEWAPAVAGLGLIVILVLAAAAAAKPAKKVVERVRERVRR